MLSLKFLLIDRLFQLDSLLCRALQSLNIIFDFP